MIRSDRRKNMKISQLRYFSKKNKEKLWQFQAGCEKQLEIG